MVVETAIMTRKRDIRKARRQREQEKHPEPRQVRGFLLEAA